jgi:integrase
MAYIHKLPSGKWRAAVRHPVTGERIYCPADPLKGVVQKWAKELEAKFARGDLRDPTAGRMKIADWYQRWIAARLVEPSSVEKIDACWRVHCLDQWGDWPLDGVTRMEAQAWVKALSQKRRARHRGRAVTDTDLEDSPLLAASTVHEIVDVMSGLYRAAVREHPPLVLINPFAELDMPRIPPAPMDFLTREEADALLDALVRLRPHEPQWPILVEMGLWMGLRPGELFGLAGDRVDWLGDTGVTVMRVMTRHGLRDYPKSRRSHRVVPIPAPLPHLLQGMAALLRGRSREDLIFTRPQGGPVDDQFFRYRIWVPAVRAAGIRPLTQPRVMRHTAASWLVQDGVPLYEVQALLGHESITTTQRYAHLVPDAHSKVKESWSRTAGGGRRLA